LTPIGASAPDKGSDNAGKRERCHLNLNKATN
jgi:hypothetical protein